MFCKEQGPLARVPVPVDTSFEFGVTGTPPSTPPSGDRHSSRSNCDSGTGTVPVLTPCRVLPRRGTMNHVNFPRINEKADQAETRIMGRLSVTYHSALCTFFRASQEFGRFYLSYFNAYTCFSASSLLAFSSSRSKHCCQLAKRLSQLAFLTSSDWYMYFCKGTHDS